MAYNIFFSDQAKQDIQNAYNWYEEQQTGLGERFFSCVEEAAISIKSAPFAFPQKHKSTREKVLRLYPFILIYLIEEKNIYVQGVFAAKQNPKKKYRKNK